MKKTNTFIFSVGLLALILSIIFYIFFDKSIALAASRISQGDFIYKASTFIGVWMGSRQMFFVALLIGIIGIYFLLRKNKKIGYRCLLIFLIYVVSYIITFAIKCILARYRPDLFLSQSLYGFSWFHTAHDLTSMPSGHAAANFALGLSAATFLYKRYSSLALLLIIYGFIVAASRVIINMHYVSDVLLSLTVVTWSMLLVFKFIKFQTA
ncbi:MAG: phosphatase PAP2 family protein [Pseudomonadota bacterium]